jgi:A/G-specific adenine glycosylase
MPAPRLHSNTVRAIRRRLLAFFDASARDLPWRRSGDPYAIWVSEVMAQQTRIDTVIPYYEDWLRRFPDVHALADAPLDDVLKAWEGLGYYSRARNLHAAARVVAERHGGAVPGDYAALRALPGIGDYTAGAVASIAFGVPAPVVDGNVRRVLARLLDEAAPAPAWLRQVAAELVPADRPGDFNQALMELGSLVCTPRSPRCDECPLRSWCLARARGTQADRPRRQPKKTTPAYDFATLILRRPDGHVLLTRRPEGGLLAGMWTFPGTEPMPGESVATAALRLARELGIRSTRRRTAHVGEVAHAFSHRRETYRCELLEVTARQAAQVTATDARWVGADASHITLSRAQQRIHGLLFGIRTRRPGSPR